MNTHTQKKRSFRWILWDSTKSKYKRNSRTRFCNSQRQRGSINQPTDAETFGAGHFKTFGGPLVARGPRVGRPCHSVMYTPIGKSVYAISKQTLTFLFSFVKFRGIFFIAISKIVHSSQSFINCYCSLLSNDFDLSLQFVLF